MSVEKISKQTTNLTAAAFIEKLSAYQSNAELEKIARYFKTEEDDYGAGDQFIGVRMGQVFEVAKAFVSMPVQEIEKLLESPVHEYRAGAVSIMDFRARDKKTTEDVKKALFELYLNRHDRINNWDLVDRAACFVVGSYLFDKPRAILYQLAVSENMWQRRTAMVSTSYFIRKGDLTDTFGIAEILINDREDLIHKAVGGWIRQAGTKNKVQLMAFLEKHAAIMPRTMLRYAIEHFDKSEREYYLNLKRID
ncbi:DNA alkylation repair protein [Pedobacter ginsenosidimutans]|uniref:DNA alkylation repair protein n=1 Tax=Pedobacter ginsenosidimutans TaxID=687842 RepID=A0A0T5VX26_9SPHI|nr:DNA alkylation repair protein [Pedobacter ginsenosidimutans]KRT18185.1 DNA alkylation repair protein [Pedobacter ginsenosidimutans]